MDDAVRDIPPEILKKYQEEFSPKLKELHELARKLKFHWVSVTEVGQCDGNSLIFHDAYYSNEAGDLILFIIKLLSEPEWALKTIKMVAYAEAFQQMFADSTPEDFPELPRNIPPESLN